jgi:hypothetical protein
MVRVQRSLMRKQFQVLPARNILRKDLRSFTLTLQVNNSMQQYNPLLVSEIQSNKSSEFLDPERFWRWCITLRITGFSDFIHRPVF